MPNRERWVMLFGKMLLNRLLSSVGYLSLLLKDGMILTLFASNHSDNGNPVYRLRVRQWESGTLTGQP